MNSEPSEFRNFRSMIALLKRIYEQNTRHKNTLTVLLLLSILPFLLISCQKEKDNPASPETDKPFAINISSETNADLFLLSEDGSYAIFDKQNEEGYTTLFINSYVENNNLGGVEVFTDNNGMPRIIKSIDQTIICGNFHGKYFDAIIYNKTGDPLYYWGLSVEEDFEKYTADLKKKMSDGITSGEKSGFDINVFTACKIISVTLMVTAALPVAATLVTGTVTVSAVLGIASIAGYVWSYVLDEDSPTLEYTNKALSAVDLGEWDALMNKKKLQLPTIGNISSVILEYTVDEAAASALNNLDTEFQEAVHSFPVEETQRPFQLQLSRYHIVMPSNPGSSTIFITTQSEWKLENENMGWCKARKTSQNVIEINVLEPYNLPVSRTVSFKIVAQNESVPPVFFTVEQTGIEYTLSSKNLHFTSDGGQDGFNVVVQSPAVVDTIYSLAGWCHVSKNGISPVNVIVNTEPNNETFRTTSIFVVLKMGDITVSEEVTVKQEGKEAESGFFAGTLFNNTSWSVTEVVDEETNGMIRYFENEMYLTKPWTSDENGTNQYSIFYSFHGDQIDVTNFEGTGSIFIIDQQLFVKDGDSFLPLDDYPVNITKTGTNEINWTSEADIEENHEHIVYNHLNTFKIEDDNISGSATTDYISEYIGSDPEYTGFIYWESAITLTRSGIREKTGSRRFQSFVRNNGNQLSIDRLKYLFHVLSAR